jgi:hypothetical protein
VLQQLGQLSEAVASCDEALKLQPNHTGALFNRGNALRDLRRLDEAVESYDRAIRLKPDFVDASYNRAFTLKDMDRQEEAVVGYDETIRLRPGHAEAHNNRGVALQELGRLDEAVKSYETAIQLKPAYPEAHRNLSTLSEHSRTDVELAAMEKLHADSEPGGADRMHLCFALSKLCEDLGEHDKCFAYLEEGNRLRKKERGYEIDGDRRLMADIRGAFPEGGLARNVAPAEDDSIRPIFIVGMPRSGTSLVEQILASHSAVHGAGELKFMSDLAAPLLSGPLDPDQSQRNQDRQVSPEAIERVRDRYLEDLAALNVDEKTITDKMPLNFRWIGLILMTFPEARIVHLNRDPRATCWSIYKHYFSVGGNGFAYDQEDLAEYYGLYLELMAFWRERFPNAIYDLCYERLTENQEDETRKLLAYCDLSWEHQCLDFHATNRPVRTASVAQVRKQMYTGSSNAWRHQEAHLQPLLRGLGYPGRAGGDPEW